MGMAGLGEILDENRRLRELLEEKDAALTEAESGRLEAESGRLEAEKQVALRDAMIESLQENAEVLAQKLERIRLEQSGAKSYRHVPEQQGNLPFTGEITPPPRAPVPEPAETEKPTFAKSKKGTPKRRTREDLAHLPSRKVRCKASDEASCVRCGGALQVIGQSDTFRVEWIPGHFIREDVIRDKCACPTCPGEGVLTVPGPYALERTLCGNGLLSRVLVDKFADHLPLNRQAKRMGREGLEITTNTLANWVLKSAGLLKVVAQTIQRELMTGAFLQGDDTGFPVQDAGNGVLRKGRLWAFTDQTQVFYAFTETKKGTCPAKILASYQGNLLLVDGGSEFNQVVREQNLERGGCWSHLRTYFFKARHHHPGEADLALGTICDLFMIEREVHGKPPDEIVALRQQKSKELVDGFFEWVEALSTYVRPKSALADALTYARNQRETLRLFLDHGLVPMHNNLSELMLRQAVVGRKNWLFARTEGGAEAASTMYTLVGSCMLQGIDPQTYLKDILDRLPEYPSNRVHELTPAAWARQKTRV